MKLKLKYLKGSVQCQQIFLVNIDIILFKKKAMTTQPIKKFKSEKGKEMLGYEGYIYTLERKTDVKLIFRCQNRDCKGMIK